VVVLKKRFILIVVIAITIVGILISYMQPRVIIKNADLLEILEVVHYLDNGKPDDITEQVNINLLAETISNYKCRKIPKSFAPFRIEDITFEINGRYSNKPLHILLGDIYIVYESSKKGGFQIINGAELLAEVDLLIES
jgi:hypothetical protein